MLLANGTFSGYMGMVQNGTVDTFAADITPSTQRLPHFDFCRPWLNNEHVVVSSMRSDETLTASLFSLVQMFASMCCYDLIAF